jgi:hypothetical protein
MRQSAIFRCPLSAQKTALLLVSGVLRRAKSFESGRARWCLARYEPDELPDCSTPRIHLSEITMQLKTRPATVVGAIANAATSARFARVIGHAPASSRSVGPLGDEVDTRSAWSWESGRPASRSRSANSAAQICAWARVSDSVEK